MTNEQFTPHFALSELIVTETGLDNIPDFAAVARLRTLAVFLEKVRTMLGGHPILINSAYRSPAVNAAVGGVPTSAHALGYACDFTCPSYGTPYQVAVALDIADQHGRIAFDQLIYEQTWVHVSREPRLRHERLTLTPEGTYVDGIVP